MKRHLALGVALLVLATFVLNVATACKTPEILVQDKPGACGEWPVDCGGGLCCPEHNDCRVERDGSHVCVYAGDDGVIMLTGAQRSADGGTR